MIYFVYSIYDEKVKTFANPFYKPTNPSAIRDFTDLAKDQNTTIGRHPEDYTLYQIGEYDDQTGLMKPYEQLNNLGKATQYTEE
jgi:hypothetical protein